MRRSPALTLTSFALLVSSVAQPAPPTPTVRRLVEDALKATAQDNDPRFSISFQDAERRRNTTADAIRKLAPDAQAQVWSQLSAKLRGTALKDRTAAASVVVRIGPTAAPVELSLLECLKTANLEVQTQAARALSSIRHGTPSPAFEKILAPHLQSELLSPDPHKRLRGLVTISLLASEASSMASLVSLVIPMLQDPEAEVRTAAVQTLGNLPNAFKLSASALLPLLRDHEPWVRAAAIRSLGRMGESALPAIPAFVEALKAKEPELREASRVSLGELREHAISAVPALILELRDADPVQRAQAAETLARIGESAKTAIPDLVQAVSDRDQDTQRNAIWALSSIGSSRGASSQEIFAPLTQLFKSRDPWVRKSAAMALGRFPQNGEAAVPLLLASLKDSDVEVRSAGAQSLADLGQTAKSATPLLIQLLSAPSSESRKIATAALERLGPDAGAALPRLLEMAKTEPDIETRLTAIQALGLVREPASGDRSAAVLHTLQGLLTNADARVRAASLTSLSSFGTQAVAALPEVQTLFKDPAATVREAAVGFVSTLGAASGPALPGIASLLKDADPIVSRRVIAAMNGLGPFMGGAVPAMAALAKDRMLPETARINALKALCRLEKYAGPAALDLITLMKDASAPLRVREHAAFALKHVGGYPPALEPALTALIDQDREYFGAIDF